MTASSPRKSTSNPLDRPWSGETYYGRKQLKPAPFDPVVVGSYIFLAGLSGASALLGSIAETAATRSGRRATRNVAPMVRRSRYLSLLAPTVGSVLLIYDLHTPARFYNMLRVAKRTSPMSIGTWILMTFSGFAGVSGGAQILSDLKPRWRWPRRIAASAQLGAGLAGAGLSTYTAALISATSTPIWAVAPRSTAVRFASSSVATAASALSFGQTSRSTKRTLGSVLLAALSCELGATILADREIKRAGIEAGRANTWGRVEKVGATGLGVMLPIGLTLAGKVQRDERLDAAASLLAIAGSALFRIAILGVGMKSAADPAVSMRFAQPDNLPAPRQ